MTVTPPTLFKWHEHARLFAGDAQITRPAHRVLEKFQSISARPTKQTLSNLGASLSGSGGFCIHDANLPSDLQVEVGDFLTLTGGSSGQPKIICRSQASWCASFGVNAAIYAMSQADAVAVFGRLSHSLALYGVLEALNLGMDAYTLDEMRPKTQCAEILRNSVTILYATPTQLRLLTRHSGEELLPAVRLILCGGGDLDSQTQLAAQALCPNASIHVFYGAAETSFITISDKDTPRGSVGRTYPGAQIRILDREGLETSDVGEVWAQSPYLFKGYVAGGSTDTKQKNGFVTVGEMGQIDANGDLWLKGRKTRMLTIADQNVFPEEIETFISTLPDIDLCVVIPTPDKVRGNRLIAVVQGTENPATATSIQDQCRAKFGPLVTPSKVLFIPAMPLLSSGKPDLPTIVKWTEDQK